MQLVGVLKDGSVMFAPVAGFVGKTAITYTVTNVKDNISYVSEVAGISVTITGVSVNAESEQLTEPDSE